MFFVGRNILWELFFWCAYRTAAPPEAYFCPSEVCRLVSFCAFLRIFCYKPIGGRNKTAGKSDALSVYPPRSERLSSEQSFQRTAEAKLLRAFTLKPSAVKRHACLLLFSFFFLSKKEKRTSFPLFQKNLLEK